MTMHELYSKGKTASCISTDAWTMGDEETPMPGLVGDVCSDNRDKHSATVSEALSDHFQITPTGQC